MPDLEQYFKEEYDDRAISPSTGVPDPVPAGKYALQVEKQEVGYTKDGKGVLLKAVIAVVSGPREGAIIHANFNINNPSQQATDIGIAELKALVAACGLQWEAVRKNSDLILYKPFEAEVGIEPESINATTGKPYPPKNRITRYIMPGQAGKEPAPHPLPGGGVQKVQKAAPPPAKPFRPDDDVPF